MAREEEIRHGATILATGAQEYRGGEYGYGSTPQVVTQQGWRLDRRRPGEDRRAEVGCDDAVRRPGRVILQPDMLYGGAQECAGAQRSQTATSRSIIFTATSAPTVSRSAYTRAAREQGVLFLRYDSERRPEVRLPIRAETSPDGLGMNGLRYEPGMQPWGVHSF